MGVRRRLPTDRDDRLRAAMLAYASEGSLRKASAKCGIPPRTIANWANSAEGQRVLEELRAGAGTKDLTARVERILDLQLTRYEAALEAGEIAPRDLAIHAGIMFDKLARLRGPKEDREGPLEVEVRFGGVRTTDGGTEAQAVSVRVKKPPA